MAVLSRNIAIMVSLRIHHYMTLYDNNVNKIRLERFLDGQVEAPGPRFAESIVGAEVRPGPLVEQDAESAARRRRELGEEALLEVGVAHRRHVRERRVSEQAVARQRAAELHFAVHQLLAAIASLAVAAGRAAVRGDRRQVPERRRPAGDEIAHRPERE